ncbi:MAG TPA: hypothetical protein DDY98_06950 [Ruminococcaceae bacterium]|nr:hypothetical protein [Oscillospiraceae bacterium]
MTVADWVRASSLEVLCGESYTARRQIHGGFCGDLLSWAMTHASENDAWMTVIGHVNTVAVAVLTKAACIVLADGAPLDEAAKKKAEENKMVVLRTQRSAFETAAELSALLQEEKRRKNE